MTEEWRPVRGYKGRYEVSDRGRVRSLPCTVRSARSSTGFRLRSGKILSPATVDGGYQQVRLYSRDAVGRPYLVHTLVLEAFVGKRPSRAHVGMHKDDTPANNRLSNLQWGTYQDNKDDAVAKRRHARGDTNGNCLYGSRTALRIHSLLLKGHTLVDTAARCGVSKSLVCHVKAGRVWGELTGRPL